MKLTQYLEKYVDIVDETQFDFTQPIFKCSKCKRLFQPMPKDGCPDCGKDIKWIQIAPKAKPDEDEMKQITGQQDMPREKKTADVSIANPYIYRGPQ